MATLGATAYTYADWVTKQDPDQKLARVVEILSVANPIVADAAVVEGNLPTGHKSVIRTGLPGGTWRQLNYGVQPEKSTTMQVTDACGMLETYAEVDTALANLNGNSGAWRASENQPFMEGMSRTMATAVIYGNTATDPTQFMGLAPRFSSTTALNGGQIVLGGSAGGQTDNTSLWFVTWSDQTCFLIFPKGGKSGLQHRDLGEDTKVLSGGQMYQVYRDHYKWDVGMVVKDWRYISRICNIDYSLLATAGESGYSGANLPNLMIDAYNKLYNVGVGQTVIYCNRAVKTALDRIAANKTNVWLSIEQYGGQPTLSFWGIPIRTCDAITNAEARIT